MNKRKASATIHVCANGEYMASFKMGGETVSKAFPKWELAEMWVLAQAEGAGMALGSVAIKRWGYARPDILPPAEVLF